MIALSIKQIVNCLLIIILSINVLNSYSQTLLIVEKSGKLKRLRYKTEDVISLKAHSNGVIYTGKIQNITSKAIVVENREIFIEDIEIIYKQRGVIRFIGDVSLKVGVGVLLINSINNLLHNEPVLEKRTIVSSSVLTPTGIVLLCFSKRRFRTMKKWQIKVID